MYTYLHTIKYYNQKNIIKTFRIDFFSFPGERSSNGTRYEKNALDLFCGA
jgi:hypothetical protein